MGFAPVLIIGAGVCGLAIAQGLQNRGLPFVIFEAEDKPSLSSSDWPMVLCRGLPTLKTLLPAHLAVRLETDAVVNRHLVQNRHLNHSTAILDGVTGEPLGNSTPERESLTVSKRKLRTLCSEGIDVKHSHTLRDIELTPDGHVIAIFSNGERVMGSTLIGADGPNSIVREQLFGVEKAKPRDIGAVFYHANFRYSDAEKAIVVRKASPTSTMVVHENCVVILSVLDVPDPERPETWEFHFGLCCKSERNRTLSSRETPLEVKEKAKVLHEPFRSALQWIPDDAEVYLSTPVDWLPTPCFTRGGRITLAGDAAHPMFSILGDGLENAVIDASEFVNTMQDVICGNRIKSEAIPSYSNEIRGRGVKMVERGRNRADLLLNYKNFKKSGLIGLRAREVLETGDALDISPDANIKLGSNPSPRERISKKESNVHKAWSRWKLWWIHQIENLDRGAEQGTAQTGWVELGHRQYGRQYFPN